MPSPERRRDEFFPSQIRVDVHHHNDADVARMLRQILTNQGAMYAQGETMATVGQNILDKVAEQTTVIDSFIALVHELVLNRTIPPETEAAIVSALSGNKAKVEAAILAHTPQAEEPPTA